MPHESRFDVYNLYGSSPRVIRLLHCLIYAQFPSSAFTRWDDRLKGKHPVLNGHLTFVLAAIIVLVNSIYLYNLLNCGNEQGETQ